MSTDNFVIETETGKKSIVWFSTVICISTTVKLILSVVTLVAVHGRIRDEERKDIKGTDLGYLITICSNRLGVCECLFPFSCFSLLTDKTVSKCKHNLVFAATVSASYRS